MSRRTTGRWWRLPVSYARVHALAELQYRAALFLQVAVTVSQVAGSLVTISLVFDRVDRLNGWTHGELIVFVGVYTVLGGLSRTFVEPAMMRMLADIGDGSFDLLLVKPAPAELLASIRAINVWALLDVATGAVITAIGIVQIGPTVGWLDASGFVVLLGCGAAILRSIWLVIGALGFWFTKLDFADAVYVGAYRASQYPIGIYPRWLEVGLIAVLPVGIAVTAPVEAITSHLTPGRLAVAIAVTGAAIAVSKLAFRAGLRRYGSASS